MEKAVGVRGWGDGDAGDRRAIAGVGLRWGGKGGA